MEQFQSSSKEGSAERQSQLIHKTSELDDQQGWYKSNPTQLLGEIKNEVLSRNKERNKGIVGPGTREARQLIKQEIYKETDTIIPGFSEAMNSIDQEYDTRATKLQNEYELLEAETQQAEQQQDQKRKVELDAKLAVLWIERLKVPLEKEEAQKKYIREGLRKKEAVSAPDEKTVENLEAAFAETLLLGKPLAEFPKEVQEKYQPSVEKYSQGLNGGASKKLENGTTLLDKTKDVIRMEYNKAMAKIGIPSSPAGLADNWIYWDLGKQKYLSDHPEESNKNYNLADPFEENNKQITADIVDRHVGWEVLNYAQHSPDFIRKDISAQVSKLLNEGIQNKRLSSYKLSELGKLIRQAKD